MMFYRHFVVCLDKCKVNHFKCNIQIFVFKVLPCHRCEIKNKDYETNVFLLTIFFLQGLTIL